jgi:segregation and condensation protein B
MSENEDLGPLSDDVAGETETETSGGGSPDTLRILEAVLFASDELITTARLKTILPDNPDAREIGKLIERINRTLQKERHPFEIVDIGGGYQFKTVAYYHPWVRQIFQEKAAKRLSIQALECLSIIAYRQPLSKAEIEAIRGVLSDGAMKTLLEKRLITVVGRSEKAGRPLLYGTTQDFLKYFGLNKIADLPQIEEFEAMVREKMEHLPIEALKDVPKAATEEIETEEAAVSMEIKVPGEAQPNPTDVDSAAEEASMEIAAPAGSQPSTEEASIEINAPDDADEPEKNGEKSGGGDGGNEGEEPNFEVKM